MKPDTTNTGERRVTAGKHCELPRGSHFYLWPVTEIEPGRLALVRTAEGAEIIGRWFPASYVAARSAGRLAMNVVIQPGRMVVDPRGEAQFLGAVIPCEDPPKPITNLSESECERFLNPFPRSLDS